MNNIYCCHKCFNESKTSFMFRRMILCSICGNKRCPKATDHNLECTGSNDEGQLGSVYGTPIEEKQLQVSERNINMRYVTDHIINPCNDKLVIAVTDEPGAGGANHRYEITGFDTNTNKSHTDKEGYSARYTREIILFQNGPIPENGVNGLTQEALLAIVADRLKSFQAGPYACRENALALTKVEEAMHWLQQRTLSRMRRNVEGTHAV